MHFLVFFQRESKFFYVNLFILSVFNSLLYSGMLYIITSTINQKELFIWNDFKWQLFLSFTLCSFIGNKLFQDYSSKLSNRVVYREELSILQRLKECSYNDFEKIGTEKVYTALEDSKVLGGIPDLLLTLLNSSIITFCGLAFLLYTFPLGFILVLIIIVTLFLFYWYRNIEIQKDLNKLRDAHNEFHKYLRDFLFGVKELKTNYNRNENVFSHLQSNNSMIKALDLKTLRKYIFNEITGSYSWYLVLFVIMFIFPVLFDFNNEKSTTFIMVIFYLMGPVSAIIGSIGTLTRIKIAFERIEEFQASTSSTLSLYKSSDKTEEASYFSDIEFRDVYYEHTDEDSKTKFKLGPLNLKIESGEVIFVTGANGSGKSTFMYILSGLYKPVSGLILVNGKEVDSLMFLSKYISPVFSDHYLFGNNYDNIDFTNSNKELQRWIELFKLESIIQLSRENNLIDVNLSRGQRKRMSLVYAIMENKPLIILDEWAAEQDPHFKKYFYQELIEYLKLQGKTIVAISHDNQYFNAAERHIKFEFGKLEKDEKIFTC